MLSLRFLSITDKNNTLSKANDYFPAGVFEFSDQLQKVKSDTYAKDLISVDDNWLNDNAIYFTTRKIKNYSERMLPSFEVKETFDPASISGTGALRIYSPSDLIKFREKALFSHCRQIWPWRELCAVDERKIWPTLSRNWWITNCTTQEWPPLPLCSRNGFDVTKQMPCILC